METKNPAGVTMPTFQEVADVLEFEAWVEVDGCCGFYHPMERNQGDGSMFKNMIDSIEWTEEGKEILWKLVEEEE